MAVLVDMSPTISDLPTPLSLNGVCVVTDFMAMFVYTNYKDGGELSNYVLGSVLWLGSTCVGTLWKAVLQRIVTTVEQNATAWKY